MAGSVLKHNKGIYAMITTFLFIMVVLFSVIAMIYIGNVMVATKAGVNEENSKYDYILDAKNRILSSECYGQTIAVPGSVSGRLAANETCDFPGGVIKGYRIKMLEYDNCTNETIIWEHMFSEEDGQRYPYFVPISNDGKICPGQLEVVY